MCSSASSTPVDDADGDDGVEKLLAPIGVDGRAHAAIARLRARVAADLATRIDEILDDRLQMRRGASAIDENRLRGAADAGAPQLGVLRDAPCHRQIGGGMNVGMANAFEMAHHGHAGVLLHARDETFAAAGHDDVDVAGHVAQHDADGLAVLRRHHLHGGLGQAVLRQGARETRVYRCARARALGAAAQDRRIAALQAQGRGIGRHVRAALVNDADDAERHSDARDLETVRPLPFGYDLPDGIVERRHRFETGGRRFEPFIVER